MIFYNFAQFKENEYVKLQDLLQAYVNRPQLKAAVSQISPSAGTPLYFEHLAGSSAALSLAALSEHFPHRDLLLVHDDADQAAYLYYDLLQLYGQDRVLMLPASFRNSIRYGGQDSGNGILRNEVLGSLAGRLDDGPEGKGLFIVAYPESFIEKVLPRTKLEEQTLRLKTGEKVDTEFISDVLTQLGFHLTDYVYEPGQFAVRGSLVDVFSWSYELPYRIDFFGDEVESIRSFDVETQLSKDMLDEIQIFPENGETVDNQYVAISEYLRKDCIIGFFDFDYTLRRMNLVCKETLQLQKDSDADISDPDAHPSGISPAKLIDGDTFFKDITGRFQCLEFGFQSHFPSSASIPFNCSPQDSFGKNFDLAAQRISDYLADGYRLFILSSNPKQVDRIRSIFHERGVISFEAVDNTLHEGFVDKGLKWLCYTDHQLFDRFHKYSLRSDKARSGKMALTLKELMQFQYGDYVVHLDHGIGRFGGLFKTVQNGKEQEVMKIMYKDNDVILVSIHNLHRVAKYRGKEGEEPVIHKLSSGAWEHIKERSKKKIKDIARDLIKLYASRLKEQGFAYSTDTYLQEALEASFIYEDTPDQAKATADIKRDMEQAKPMDRLVCGDVGFGKTELAVRAAFKAVADGKQVAVLVPTTVLALQHYQTFKDRLKDLPCTVDYISRTRSNADIRQILTSLPQGKPDILVGTHKLIGKDVKFNDLGLLIIDEEQKFGVAVKEKLRQMKTHIDTLTLTATPIPRTLQFSLMGARDLSVLSTPPANRYPIRTEICPFDKDIIREGIEYELERNGQVFFVSNRIGDLAEIESLIHKCVPQARTVIAHGQMDGAQLEQIIIDFINYEYDVLICTTIIESGVDIPNVNTIFVNAAHKFGLSDLHQLRGRVGRTNRKAFCYLISPPTEFLNPDAKRRLQAIESFSELGSGLNIAMQDLDIRGAGNMLGAEQSGFIADLGFETYQRILKEALHELKEEEFADLYAREAEDKDSSTTEYVSDCQLESDLSLFFDETYVPGSSERMALYREMDQLENEKAVDDFQKRMTDRFGPLPKEGEDLIRFIRIRLLAKKLGIERISLKNNQMICHFVSDSKSPFYNSPTFGGILHYVTEHYRRCRLREAQGRRSMILSDIDSTQTAYQCLSEMLGTEALH